jgi:hypothetical protein
VVKLIELAGISLLFAGFCGLYSIFLRVSAALYYKVVYGVHEVHK